jgi:hypothetical protein
MYSVAESCNSLIENYEFGMLNVELVAPWAMINYSIMNYFQ